MRRLRRLGLTSLGWVCLAVVLAIVLACGILTARVGAQEVDPLEAAALAVWATPTPEPTPTEAPRYQPSNRGPRAAAEEVVARHFPPEAVPQAMAVLVCESRLDPGATGRAGERGYFQIHPLWQALAERLYGPGADLYDVEVNAGVAAEIWRSSGWAPWSCQPW